MGIYTEQANAIRCAIRALNNEVLDHAESMMWGGENDSIRRVNAQVSMYATLRAIETLADMGKELHEAPKA